VRYNVPLLSLYSFVAAFVVLDISTRIYKRVGRANPNGL